LSFYASILPPAQVNKKPSCSQRVRGNGFLGTSLFPARKAHPLLLPPFVKTFAFGSIIDKTMLAANAAAPESHYRSRVSRPNFERLR